MAELEGVAASFATELQPETFCEDPVFPVRGTVTIELQDGPTVVLSFTLREGYGREGESANAAEIHLSSHELSRHHVDLLNAWAHERIAAEEGGGMEVMGVCLALGDAVEELGIEVEQAPVVVEAEVTPAVSVEFKMSAEELERHKDHSGMLEKQCDRQWLTFTMFNSAKHAKELQEIALSVNLTGFLALGKPAVACLEGGPKAIAEALEGIRKELFARVEKQARKMSLPMMEQACTRVRFEGFAVIRPTAASDRTMDPSLREISDISGTTATKRCRRHDVAPCDCDPWDFRPFDTLREFLISRGIVDKTIRDVCSNKIQ